MSISAIGQGPHDWLGPKIEQHRDFFLASYPPKAKRRAAHLIGINVILDVVYNHLGPDGNYLACSTPDYFSKTHKTEWGDAMNIDGDRSVPVRDFFIANAAHWIGEFHFDGLRLDATQSMFNDSSGHIITVIARAARAAAGTRSIILIAENEPRQTCLVRPQDEHGLGLDALWNDDFHIRPWWR